VENALFRKLNHEKALVVDSQKIGETFSFMFYSANVVISAAPATT